MAAAQRVCPLVRRRHGATLPAPPPPPTGDHWREEEPQRAGLHRARGGHQGCGAGRGPHGARGGTAASRCASPQMGGHPLTSDLTRSRCAGTIIEVNVSELGLVTPGGKVVWGKFAQVRHAAVLQQPAGRPPMPSLLRARRRSGAARVRASLAVQTHPRTPPAACLPACAGHQQPRERRLHQRCPAGVDSAALLLTAAPTCLVVSSRGRHGAHTRWLARLHAAAPRALAPALLLAAAQRPACSSAAALARAGAFARPRKAPVAYAPSVPLPPSIV